MSKRSGCQTNLTAPLTPFKRRLKPPSDLLKLHTNTKARLKRATSSAVRCCTRSRGTNVTASTVFSGDLRRILNLLGCQLSHSFTGDAFHPVRNDSGFRRLQPLLPRVQLMDPVSKHGPARRLHSSPRKLAHRRYVVRAERPAHPTTHSTTCSSPLSCKIPVLLVLTKQSGCRGVRFMRWDFQ